MAGQRHALDVDAAIARDVVLRGGGGFFLALAEIERGDIVLFDGQYLNLEALQQFGFDDFLQFFGRMGFSVAQTSWAKHIEIRRVAVADVDNAEAGAIAHAHVLLGERVSTDSWSVCAAAYRDPRNRTPLQLAAVLAQWMHLPRYREFAELAARERDRLRDDDAFRVQHLGRWPDRPR